VKLSLASHLGDSISPHLADGYVLRFTIYSAISLKNEYICLVGTVAVGRSLHSLTIEALTEQLADEYSMFLDRAHR
jgi:hypothetical protein